MNGKLASGALAVVVLSGFAPPSDTAWPVNGGVDNIRYSALTQINRTNVSQLKVAWTYDSHDAFKGSEMQSNPIVVDGVLYATTPTLKVVAVDAATGVVSGTTVNPGYHACFVNITTTLNGVSWTSLSMLSFNIN